MMKQYLTEEQLLNNLKVMCKEAGEQSRIAKSLKISTSYLCDIIHKRRSLSSKMANVMGYKRIVHFVRKS